MIISHLQDKWTMAALGNRDAEESPDCIGTAYRLTTGRRDPTIRATETNRLNPGETGNLYAQQLQIGPTYESQVEGRVEGLTYRGNMVCRLIMLATRARYRRNDTNTGPVAVQNPAYTCIWPGGYPPVLLYKNNGACAP